MPVTQQLVGRTQRPNVWKISQGAHIPDRKGILRPGKYWGWRVMRSWMRDSDKHMLVEEPLQHKLLEHLGLDVAAYKHPDKTDPKVRSFPIQFWSNNPLDILSGRRAAYWGGRTWCSCSGFVPKERRFAVDVDGLPWEKEWPPDEEAARAAGMPWPPEAIASDETYWHGVCRREDLWGPQVCTNPTGASRWHTRCNPSGCPMVLGTHGVRKYAGKPLCKADVKFRFLLDFPGAQGDYGYASSTGWNTWNTARTTLADRFELCGGWLVGVPMLLALGTESRTIQGKDGPMSTQIPIVRFDYGCELHEAQRLAGANAERYKQIAEARNDMASLFAQGRQVAGLLTGPQAEEEFSHEFSNRTHDEQPGWEAELRSLMAQQDASMSDAAVLAEVARAREDPEVALRTWRGKLGIAEEEDLPPAEPEDLPDVGETESGSLFGSTAGGEE